MTFVTGSNGRPEALPGTHDDQVMCAAIAHRNLSAATKYVPARLMKYVTPQQLARNPTLALPKGFQRLVGFDYRARGLIRRMQWQVPAQSTSLVDHLTFRTTLGRMLSRWPKSCRSASG